MASTNTPSNGTVREALGAVLESQARTQEYGVGISWGDGEAGAFVQWARATAEIPIFLDAFEVGVAPSQVEVARSNLVPLGFGPDPKDYDNMLFAVPEIDETEFADASALLDALEAAARAVGATDGTEFGTVP